MIAQNGGAPAVSVVMAVYEPHAEFFPQAVKSILEQTWRDLELIIVEDPSERRGETMLDGPRDPRLRYVANTERTGLVAQRNQCLESAAGRYIALMDADDVAAPCRLAKQVEYLDRHLEIDVLGSQIAIIDARGATIGRRCFPVQHENLARALTRIVPLSQPSVMMRRSVFERFGGYRFTEYPAAEDYEYWSRLVQQGVRFANHPDVLLSYRLHARQTKFCKLRQTILAHLRVKELYWSDRMDLPAQVWRQSEKLLLHLPKWLVVWLLKSLYYHVGGGRWRAKRWE